MTFRRFAVSLLSVCSLLACSDEDAIVALNVTAGADVPVVEQLHVTITQGSRKLVYDFKPPVEEAMDGTRSIQNSFFERITLPDSFEDQDALIQVEARQTGGAPFDPPLTDETTVRIEEDGVVAAYVKLELPATMPEPEGGAGGAGGAGGDSGAVGNAGAAGEATAPGEGGAGGLTNQGGAPADAAAGAGG